MLHESYGEMSKRGDFGCKHVGNAHSLGLIDDESLGVGAVDKPSTWQEGRGARVFVYEQAGCEESGQHGQHADVDCAPPERQGSFTGAETTNLVATGCRRWMATRLVNEVYMPV